MQKQKNNGVKREQEEVTETARTSPISHNFCSDLSVKNGKMGDRHNCPNKLLEFYNLSAQGLSSTGIEF